MARYVVSVRTPMPPDEAFTYMADLRNFAEWDPGVKNVDQVTGDGPGPGTAFDVTVKGFVGDLTLRYVTTEHDAPKRVVARAESTMLTSLDTITVEPDGDGSVVTYDAELTLNGPLGLADPLLKPAFNSIGDKAAGGLIRALEGERVADGAS